VVKVRHTFWKVVKCAVSEKRLRSTALDGQQWFTGWGIWTTIRSDIWIFFIWLGWISFPIQPDLVPDDQMNKMWPCKKS